MSTDLEHQVRDALAAAAPSTSPLLDWATLHSRARRRTAVRRGAAVATAGALATVLVLSTPWAPASDGSDSATQVSPSPSVPASGAPGAPLDTPLAPATTSTHTGPATIELDGAPAGTTHVAMIIVCLSPGTLTYPDGASLTCGRADVGGDGRSQYTLPVPATGSTLAFDAGPDFTWELTTTYVNRTETEWATNASGDTYGVAKADGSEPDLVAVIATNGEVGYAYTEELRGPDFANPEEALAWEEQHGGEVRTVAVYREDGVTKIGEFHVG
jgi:hypothetical protein